MAAERGNSEILQKVWDWAKENLTTEEINNNLLLGTDRDGRTAWHIAAERGNSEIFKKVWWWAKENLTEEINNKLLLSTDKQSVCWWVSNSSGNVGCQQTVNSMQLKLLFSAVQYR